MKKQNKIGRNKVEKKINTVSNLMLGVLVLSVGALCLSPSENALLIDGEQSEIYRSADQSSTGVSLMLNVYWGTEEVYRILDILQARNAKATFFIGGCWADDNVECLRAIFAAGHEIGNHGYFHKDHAKLSVLENQREISSCNRFIELALGEAPTLFAPPSGAYGTEMLSACKSLSMKTILWTRDTIDWRDKDSEIIYSRATKDIQGGEFVLMHPMQATADALDGILQYYQEQSLTVITVSENLKWNEKG